MKIKTILSTLFVLFASVSLYSQVKNSALKFDEFSDFPAETVSPLYDRTERFAKRMKREPLSTKAVVIFYNQRKGKYPLESGKEWGYRAGNYLNNSFKIPEVRVAVIDGGYRDFPTLEFWIVPKDAEMPTPTPAFTKNEIIYCPEINVAGDGFRHDRNEPLKFSVAINGAGTNESLPLEWSVSAGKIISGQGTNQIQIDLSETDASKITAAVLVKGLAPECDCHAYNSTVVGFYPYKIDEFPHVPYSEIVARMDAYFVQLANEPTMTGYIIIYGSRQGKKRDVARVTKSLRDMMAFRRYDTSRVTIVDGGLREEMWVEVYLVPPGSEPPKPTPTLNSDFAVEPKVKPSKKRRTRK
jgi:hypothetical protein